jgi:uncharacterized membrane protein
LIAAATFLMAAGATILGAWMVLPFAGAELSLVWLAFKVIGAHDNDYESLRISDQEFLWEHSDRGQLSTLRGNRAWVQVIGEPVGSSFELYLRYAGKRVAIARVLSGEQRRQLSFELVRLLGNR